jgi:hypothetical protein
LCKPRDVETHEEHRSLRYRQLASILTCLLRMAQAPSLLTNLRERVSLSKFPYYFIATNNISPFQNSPILLEIHSKVYVCDSLLIYMDLSKASTRDICERTCDPKYKEVRSRQ